MPDNVAVELSVTLAGFEEISQRAPLRWPQGTRWERGHPAPRSASGTGSRRGRDALVPRVVPCKRRGQALVEGETPSFPGLFHASVGDRLVEGETPSFPGLFHASVGDRLSSRARRPRSQVVPGTGSRRGRDALVPRVVPCKRRGQALVEGETPSFPGLFHANVFGWRAGGLSAPGIGAFPVPRASRRRPGAVRRLR